MTVYTGLSATYINQPKDKYVPSILLSDLNLSKETASLNCSFKALNPDGVIVEVDAVNINDVNLGEIKGVAVFVNGTAVNCTESFFGINPIDVICVNVVVPYEGNSYLLSTLEDDHFKVQVQTPDAMFYVET